MKHVTPIGAEDLRTPMQSEDTRPILVIGCRCDQCLERARRSLREAEEAWHIDFRAQLGIREEWT